MVTVEADEFRFSLPSCVMNCETFAPCPFPAVTAAPVLGSCGLGDDPPLLLPSISAVQLLALPLRFPVLKQLY